jgi:predicted secreted protein with PEFG-CTERM motif
MNLQRSATVASLILMSVTILSGFAFQNNVFADQGMLFAINADEGSDTILVSGITSKTWEDLSIIVAAPNGNVINIAQVTPDANGNFMSEIKVGGSQWKQDGFYAINLKQGVRPLYDIVLIVEVVGGTTVATSVSESTIESLFTGGTVIRQLPDLIIKADAVPGSTTISISGNTDRLNMDITIIVTAPNGNIISVDQVTPDANGDFMTDIQTSKKIWKQDGIYTITAEQGTDAAHKSKVEVEIVDGRVIPEFGAIAGLILAVSIISIIAVSAKARLRIIPRF